MTDTLALDKNAQDLLFRSARTANSFTDEPVTDEQLRAIYDLVPRYSLPDHLRRFRVLATHELARGFSRQHGIT
ncbi:hypothetical protein ABZ634_19005, partial [Nocardiopsis alba]